MGTLVPVGGVNARSDEPVAQIVTGVKRGIRVGTVEGIYVERVIERNGVRKLFR